MKALETVEIHGKKLTILVDEIDIGKAAVSYFIDGVELTQWDTLPKLYQNLFTTIADALCEGLSLQKWMY